MGGYGGNGGYGGPLAVADRWVGGVVTGLARKYTRKGELMATFFLEDLQSSIEVFVFPRTMTEVGYLLADDAVICVKGRLDLRDEVPKLVCSELEEAPAQPGRGGAIEGGPPGQRPRRHPGPKVARTAPRAPWALTGLPACWVQSGPPSGRAQRGPEPRPFG